MKKQSILYMILAALALSVLVAGVRSSETVGGPDATLAAWAEAAATATPAPTPSPAPTPTPMPLGLETRRTTPRCCTSPAMGSSALRRTSPMGNWPRPWRPWWTVCRRAATPWHGLQPRASLNPA